jgi:hypothetical protein
VDFTKRNEKLNADWIALPAEVGIQHLIESTDFEKAEMRGETMLGTRKIGGLLINSLSDSKLRE